MSADDVLAALDFPIRCNGCGHPAEGHVGSGLKCGECGCSRSNPGGVAVEGTPEVSGETEVRECVCGREFEVIVEYARPWTVCRDCSMLGAVEES